MNAKSLLAASLAAALLSGCSLLRKQEEATVDSPDAMPLYPVNIYTGASISGHWYITTVGSIKLTGYESEDWPFLEFMADEGRFYGNNGCNIINGTYHVSSGQELRLSNVAATMRLCPADTLEFPIARALDSVRAYSVSTARDGSTLLSLHNDKNLTVMTLRKSDIDFINGAWRVTAINGEEVTTPDCRLVFDVAEGTIHGDTGCNLLNGVLTREAKRTGALGFSALRTTRRACPDLATEQKLLIALEEVTSASRGDHGDIALLNTAGTPIIQLTPLKKADVRSSAE